MHHTRAFKEYDLRVRTEPKIDLDAEPIDDEGEPIVSLLQAASDWELAKEAAAVEAAKGALPVDEDEEPVPLQDPDETAAEEEVRLFRRNHQRPPSAFLLTVCLLRLRQPFLIGERRVH